MVLTHYKAGTRTLLETARAWAFRNSNPSPEPAKARLQGRAFQGRVGLGWAGSQALSLTRTSLLLTSSSPLEFPTGSSEGFDVATYVLIASKFGSAQLKWWDRLSVEGKRFLTPIQVRIEQPQTRHACAYQQCRTTAERRLV